MDLEGYRYLFCALAGISWGVLHFAYKALTVNCAGVFCIFMERDDEGDLKIFNSWNLGLYSAITILVFFWLSGMEGTPVYWAMIKSWEYFWPVTAGQ